MTVDATDTNIAAVLPITEEQNKFLQEKFHFGWDRLYECIVKNMQLIPRLFLENEAEAV